MQKIVKQELEEAGKNIHIADLNEHLVLNNFFQKIKVISLRYHLLHESLVQTQFIVISC